MSRLPTKNIDYTSRDYEAFRDLLITKLQEKMPEYTDTSETDAGIVIIEALANGLDILSLYADIVANDVILPTTQSRRLAVLIARCLGYTPYNQTASEYKQIFTLTTVRNVDTIIPRGTVVKTKEDTDISTLYYETMDDLIIPAGNLGNETNLDDSYKYTVTVKAGRTIRQDILGKSSGSPLQSFRLTHTEVLIDSIELYVNQGQGLELWTQVDSFYDSNENSKVYMVIVDDFNQCIIQFGNGIKGAIPISYPNGIVANYRIGGGTSSNVEAGVINSLETAIAYIGSTFNLSADVLGHDKESLESIKFNAPASYRSRDRLVTLQDYEDLLRINFIEFLDIQAINGTGANQKKVYIYYMLREGYSLTNDLTSRISNYINDRSMIGTSFELGAYTSQSVNLTATLYVNGDYDVNVVKQNVADYIQQVMFKYGSFVFDDYIIKSDFESEIKNTIDGVISFRITSPNTDIISPLATQNILTLGTLTINASTL